MRISLTERLRCTFTSGSDDIYLDDLVHDSFGNLYGVTLGYGNDSDATVLELSPYDIGWVLKVLLVFRRWKSGVLLCGAKTINAYISGADGR